MNPADESIGVITRECPHARGPQDAYTELMELWALRQGWQAQLRELEAEQERLTIQTPESAEILAAVLGTPQEFTDAGTVIEASLTARLQELSGHDLAAAMKRGELSADERAQIEQIQLQWTREGELRALGDLSGHLHDRDR